MKTLLVILVLITVETHAQVIFAHNDYAQPNPFYRAFDLKAVYIEADIFLRDGVLLIAHSGSELDASKTLESMYLKPLTQKINELYGLTLMIDLKTEGTPTMAALVKLLDKYEVLTSSSGLFITVSGSYPPPSEWKNYPDYIFFDGRPGIIYTEDQLNRITLISTSFGSISKWNGEGELPADDLAKLKKVITHAHDLGKPVRFWGSPDAKNAWEKFIQIGVDVLNSDNIEELSKYLTDKNR